MSAALAVMNNNHISGPYKGDSVSDATQGFIEAMNETLEKLRQIWDKCGILDEKRGDRVSMVYKQLHNLLSKMLEEETEMMQNLKNGVNTYKEEVSNLRKELQLEQKTQNEDLTLIQLEATLRQEVEELTKIKQNRFTELKEMKSRDLELCSRLDEKPYFISEESVPSIEQLKAFEKHVADNERKLFNRKSIFHESKAKIGRLFTKMRQKPSEDFETRVLRDSEAEFVFSNSKMNLLQDLLLNTENSFAEFVESLEKRFEEAKLALELMWDKCHVTDEDRAAVPSLNQDNLSEKLIELYDAELAKWEHYFNSRQAVLGPMHEWNKLWKMKVSHDQRQQDPNRFKNRGGNLEKELKALRNLDRNLLPGAEREVSEAWNQWKESRPDAPVLFEGLEPLEYIAKVMRDYQQSNERAKNEKMQAKQEQHRQATPTSLRRKAAPPGGKRAPSPSHTPTQSSPDG